MAINTESVRKSILERIARIADLTAEQIAREKIGEDFSFAAAVPLVRTAQRLTAAVAPMIVDGVPPNRLGAIQASLENLLVRNIDLILNFRPIAVQNADVSRNQMLDSLGNAVDDLFNSCSVLLSMRTIDPVADFAVKLAEMNAGFASANQALDNLKKRVTEQGVADEAGYFDRQSFWQYWRAWGWLFCSIALAGAILMIAYHAYTYPIPVIKNDLFQAAQRIGAKLVFVSILSFALVFTIRNYSTSRHNYILNRHRAIALTTFRAFVQGADDAETKKQVLLAATKTVFAPQNTGYLRKSDAGSFPVLDFLKFASGK